MSGLEELRRLEGAATPGPWAWEDKASGRWLLKGSEQGVMRCASMLWPGHADAEFIVAARNQLPRILDALDAVLATTYESDDGSEYEHNRGCEGEPTCPACWATDIRAAITKALEGAGHE